MVSSWLLKVILGIALAGAIAIEVGSPLIARAQADDAAHQVANETALKLGRRTFTNGMLEEACASEAAKVSVEIVTCEFDKNADEVVVRVRKNARSLVLKNWSATEDWYHPEVTARAVRR